MNTHIDKAHVNKSNAVASNISKQQSKSESAFQFEDNRPEAIAQRKLNVLANSSPQVKQFRAVQLMANNYTSQIAQRKENLEEETLQGKFKLVQKKENNTGLPDNLKSGVENLSGYSLDDVKVHYDSDKPAQLNAHAYAQGTDIHLGAGQEKHLPHEAWHVVQQKQGRVKPTLQMKGGVNVNDDVALENEADVMGRKAMQFMAAEVAEFNPKLNSNQNLKQGKITDMNPAQRMMDKLGVDKDKYRQLTMSTVYLYAEFNGTPIGVFQTQRGNHAEENLIQHLIKQGFENGNLVVYLSTSPCSSVFCTRGDGKEGCQERLESLKLDRNIIVTVHADHLYQPQALVSQEAEFGSKGYSSFSSASTSAFKMTFSSLPNMLNSPDMMDGFDQPVAQLKKTLQFVDNRPECIENRELQEMANNSPQTKHVKAYQEMANNYTSQTAQLKENLEVEVLQGKFDSMQKKQNESRTVVSRNVIQKKLDKEKLAKVKVTLGLVENIIKVIEVPNNQEVIGSTKFNNKAYEGFTDGLDEVALNLTMAEAAQNLDYNHKPAHEIIEVAGGAAYIESVQIAFLKEGIIDYEKVLRHEIGHFKQDLKGFNLNNKCDKILLEYHNIIVHENLGEVNARVFYVQDVTGTWSENVSKLEQDKKETKLNSYKVMAEITFENLRKSIVEGSKNGKMFIEIEAAINVWEGKAKNDDERLSIIRFKQNIGKEVKIKL